MWGVVAGGRNASHATFSTMSDLLRTSRRSVDIAGEGEDATRATVFSSARILPVQSTVAAVLCRREISMDTPNTDGERARPARVE